MTDLEGQSKSHQLMEEDEEDPVVNLNFAIKYSKFFFKMMGLYPDVVTNPPVKHKNLWRLVIPVPTFFVLSWLGPLLTHVITRDLTVDEIFGCIGPIIYQITNMLKNYLLLIHRNSLKLCIQHMETDWRKIETREDRDIMRRHLELGHRVSLMCTATLYGGAVLFNSMAFFDESHVNEWNQTIRPLRLPGADIFLDLTAGYNYEIVVCFNWVSNFFINTIVSTFCDLTAILVAHTCGQIQIIESRLEALIECEEKCNAVVIKERVSFIVDTHVRALRFAAQVDQLLQGICLLEILCATLLIAWLEYSCVKNLSTSSVFDLFANSFLLISFCFNIFIFCHISENLKEKFEEIGRVAYMLEWYRMPEKTALALIMLIAVAKNPPRLTAGQMIELSYYSFCNIIRSSFAYLNILLQ